MVYTSEGARAFSMGEKLYLSTLFVRGRALKRSHNKPKPCWENHKGRDSAGQEEIYVKLTYLGVSFFFPAGAFLSRHTIWSLDQCTWLTRRTDNTFQFCTLCLCFSSEVALAYTPCGVLQRYPISILFLRGTESLRPCYPLDCDALDYLCWTLALFHRSVNILNVFLTL